MANWWCSKIIKWQSEWYIYLQVYCTYKKVTHSNKFNMIKHRQGGPKNFAYTYDTTTDP